MADVQKFMREYPSPNVGAESPTIPRSGPKVVPLTSNGVQGDTGVE
jgi:hypothetical protein